MTTKATLRHVTTFYQLRDLPIREKESERFDDVIACLGKRATVVERCQGAADFIVTDVTIVPGLKPSDAMVAIRHGVTARGERR